MVPLPTASGTVTEVEGITDYIKTIYLFAMGIAGILAMALIVVSGFQWLTATGSMSTIGQAKARINNAILGLIVLLSAYLLLNTINPALVNLKEPVLLFLDWTENFENAAGGTPPGGGTKPAECFEADGTTPKITICNQYWTTLRSWRKCLANACEVPGPCYITSELLDGCGSCNNSDGTPLVTACQDQIPLPGSSATWIHGYVEPNSCNGNSCGVSGGCHWGGFFCNPN
jgi:hypothetical protein